MVARHRLAADGAGIDVRDHGHVIALNQAAMAAASTRVGNFDEPKWETSVSAINLGRRSAASDRARSLIASRVGALCSAEKSTVRRVGPR